MSKTSSTIGHIQTETFNDVVIKPALKPLQHKQLLNMLEQYSNILTDIPKVISLLQHAISMTTIGPQWPSG